MELAEWFHFYKWQAERDKGRDMAGPKVNTRGL